VRRCSQRGALQHADIQGLQSWRGPLFVLLTPSCFFDIDGPNQPEIKLEAV